MRLTDRQKDISLMAIRPPCIDAVRQKCLSDDLPNTLKSRLATDLTGQFNVHSDRSRR